MHLVRVQVGSEPPLDEASDAFAVLSALGPSPRHVGGFGAASAMKLALNQLIASETVRERSRS
jgi:3-hydroxyisobutyrate dehydrogenase-like beta-hydroxyacid dehydrogenase